MLMLRVRPARSATSCISRDADRAAGYLDCQNAPRALVPVDRPQGPAGERRSQAAHLSLHHRSTAEELEFSEGFTDLHTESYREILAGNGFGIDTVRPSIEIASQMRRLPLTDIGAAVAHPWLARR